MVSCYLLVSFSVFQKWRILFLRQFFWPQNRGPPGARGPGSLNHLNPRFLRHCPLLFELPASGEIKIIIGATTDEKLDGTNLGPIPFPPLPPLFELVTVCPHHCCTHSLSVYIPLPLKAGSYGPGRGRAQSLTKSLI